MARKIMTIRLWILLVFLILSVFAISPNPWAEGVEINTVKQGSVSAENGISSGEIIKSINGNPINNLNDYKEIVSELEVEPFEITINTENKTFTYNVTTNLGFETKNITVMSSEDSPLEYGMEIRGINGNEVNSYDDILNITKGIFKKEKFTMVTNQGEYAFLLAGPPEITVKLSEKTNIRKGLDLAGGTRVLIKPESEDEITNQEIDDLIKVMNNRLNVYGLKDLKIRSATDWEGTKYILIEIADITGEEVKELIEKQGNFEAKIGNDTVFIGGEKDITFVCRGDGSCSGIRDCSLTPEGSWYCKFEFIIHLSPEAAKEHARITAAIPTKPTADGREILEKNIDFYLDGKLVDSLQISSDLKGNEATAIAISGPGVAQTEKGAIDEAIKNMGKLQTVLITGSLPLEINIVKMDTISPMFGKNFIRNSLFVGFFAILAVALVVFVRYRNFKIILPMIFTMLSELLIILGFAALFKWNLDLTAIAGIIAAIGTGVDDQIIITDEVLRGAERFISWKEKIKRSFFIIIVAFFTTFFAMIPLFLAGAGLIRGFATTILAGITIGVFLTRPAYASIIEKLLNR